MRRLNPKIAKVLKAAHITCVALWFGGVATWIPLLLALPDATFVEASNIHTNMQQIAYNVIGWGGIGSFATGVLLGILTPWKIFKYRWVTVKFFSVIAMIVFGMFYMDARLVTNIGILEQEQAAALTNAAYINNVRALRYGAFGEVIVFASIVLLSTIKPWVKGTALRTAHDVTSQVLVSGNKS